MIDRESVIRQLTQHIARADYIETDWIDCVSVPMLRGALELLKADQYYRQALNEMNEMDDVCKSCQEFTCDDCKIWDEKHRRANDDHD